MELGLSDKEAIISVGILIGVYVVGFALLILKRMR
jgi:hypothetical protein